MFQQQNFIVNIAFIIMSDKIYLYLLSGDCLSLTV